MALSNQECFARHSRPKVRRRGDNRRGAAAVEFAVVAIPFFFLILGIIEVGRGFMVLEVANNAARAGARTGAVAIGNYDTVKSTTETALRRGFVVPGADPVVRITPPGGGTAVTVKNNVEFAAQAKNGSMIEVQVQPPFAQNSWLPGGLWVRNYRPMTASMRREQ